MCVSSLSPRANTPYRADSSHRSRAQLVFVDEPEFERLSAAEHEVRPTASPLARLLFIRRTLTILPLPPRPQMREKMTADGMSVTSAEDWRKISREVTDADKAAGMASIDVKNVHV